MQAAHLRHDISDRVWELLEPHLPGRAGDRGVTTRDNRLFINAAFWILRTGAPWRDLPPDYGDWKNTHRRFCRWRDKGQWERLLEIFVNEPDFEWLMIDASHIKVHPQAAGACGGNQDMTHTKGASTPRYIWAWMRMECRSECLLQRVPLLIVQRLVSLSIGIKAENLLADKGYDSDEFVDSIKKSKIIPVIPPRKFRKTPREYDKYLYRLRHMVENAFLKLKRWRGISKRYAKNTSSFLAAVHIRCIDL